MADMNSGEEDDNNESDFSNDLAASMDVDEFNPTGSSDFEIEIGYDDDEYEEVDEEMSENSEEGSNYDSSSGGEVYENSSESDDNSRPQTNMARNNIAAAIRIINEAIGSEEDETLNAYPTNSTNDDKNNQDEAFSCSICLEGLTNTGSHRPACLKCGHIFGEKCLERWIKVGCNSEARRCPTCNTKATLKDIRILYAKQLTAIDTTELTALEMKLDLEQRDKGRILAEVEKYKVKNQYLMAENERLKSVIENSKFGLPSTSGPTSLRKCLKKIVLCRSPGCRVMAYNKSNMMLAVGHQSDSPLFTNTHVIRKLNASNLEIIVDCIYAHTKQIRDMTFHPNEINLLASVSLDKYIKLIDMGSNTVVSQLLVDVPLWSCCWAGDNPNILVAGSQMGSLYYIDRRYMKLLDTQCEQKFACVSLNSLPPSSSRSFINGGFIKTRMDVMSVFEHDIGPDPPNYKISELPLKGLWSSCSYDNQSNLLLSSSKPCGANKSVRHIVSQISDFNVEGPSINPVATFYGGDKATQLFRSCIVPSNGLNEDSLVCCYDEKSNFVKLFSINSGNNIHNYQMKENILDLCPLTGVIMDNRRIVAGLSETSVSIFSV